MRAGALRHQVTLQSSSLVQNALGEMVPTWGTFATMFASFEPLSGTEVIQAAQINAKAIARICIRYLPGVTVQMRILYGTRTFEITNIANIDERNRELELTCAERE